MDNSAVIKRLSVAFQIGDNPLVAVDNVAFELLPGKTTALLGESGCGKSLTSLALTRLLPLNSTYGVDSQVLFDGQDLLDVPERVMQSFRGKRLAMIFQEPMTALNPVLTIGQQVYEALNHYPSMSKKEKRSKVISLLKEVELPEPSKRFDYYPHQLSGGQKQRVVIAIALACEPDILIADEPTTALDVTIQAQILDLLKRLQHRHHMSLLLITHDLTFVKAMADQVCVMYAGQIVESASVNDFFNQPLHPYSQQLLLSIPALDKRGQRLHAIQGTVPTLDAMPSGCRFHPRCLHVFEPCSTLTPKLQTVADSNVRCHLYPALEKPPEIMLQHQAFQKGKLSEQQLLNVKDLSIHFTSGGWLNRNKTIFKAVDGLSFNLMKGKTLALVGESGCGKTTTARAIMRLLPITSGVVNYQGQPIQDLKGKPLRQYRKKVQIIFQDPYSSMNPRMTVDEIIAEGMVAQGMSANNIRARQLKLIDQVNLPQSSLSRYPHQFSGGQRQRICIARALATEPELLICDEPTSALDISVQAQILNLLKDLQDEYQLSYLFITHNMAVVSYIADEVLVMKNGQSVEQGETEDLFNHPKHDYTQRLLASVLTD